MKEIKQDNRNVTNKYYSNDTDDKGNKMIIIRTKEVKKITANKH